MPTFPLAYFLVVGSATAILSHFLEKKKVLIICLILFAGISMKQLSTSSFHYLYENYQESNVAQDYTDEYCVVISEDHGYWYYDVQALTQYRGFYWLRDTEDQDLVENAFEVVVPEGEFVLYARNTWTPEQIVDYVHKNFGNEWSCQNLQKNSERYFIYHCQKE